MKQTFVQLHTTNTEEFLKMSTSIEIGSRIAVTWGNNDNYIGTVAKAKKTLKPGEIYVHFDDKSSMSVPVENVLGNVGPEEWEDAIADDDIGEFLIADVEDEIEDGQDLEMDDDSNDFDEPDFDAEDDEDEEEDPEAEDEMEEELPVVNVKRGPMATKVETVKAAPKAENKEPVNTAKEVAVDAIPTAEEIKRVFAYLGLQFAPIVTATVEPAAPVVTTAPRQRRTAAVEPAVTTTAPARRQPRQPPVEKKTISFVAGDRIWIGKSSRRNSQASAATIIGVSSKSQKVKVAYDDTEMGEFVLDMSDERIVGNVAGNPKKKYFETIKVCDLGPLLK